MSVLAVPDIKRLGIFVFYNKAGKAEEYVDYLLASIRPYLSELFLVSNCELTYKTQKSFKKYTENIFIRENTGLDAAAYKKALLYYCGMDVCREYDEVILFNDTIYGPFISFDKIFTSMNSRDIDFWGILAGYQSEDSTGTMSCGYIPDHIQSWFWVFRKSLLNSNDFWFYWKRYDDSINNFWDVVSKHEFVFTNYFEKLGFKWDIYSDSEPYRSSDLRKNYNFYGYSANLMLQEMHTPFLKRKPFSLPRHELLYMNGGEDMKLALNYVDQHTDYPSKLIYGDLLSNYNVYDIYNSLHLNYILPYNYSVSEINILKEVGIFLLCHSIKSCLEITKYIASIYQYIDTYIIMSEDLAENIKASVKDQGLNTDQIHFVVSRAESYLCLKEVPGWENYKYILFVHDAVCYWRDKPDTVYQSILYNYLENILKTREFVQNIIQEFESDPSLGLLEAPMPIHHNYFHFYENSWGGYYEKVKEMSEAVHLKCNMEQNKQIISASGAFCCKRIILDKLLSSLLTDNTHIPDEADVFNRLTQFMAQDAGYCTGLIYNAEYASLELANFRFYLNSIMGSSKFSEVSSSYFNEYIENFKSSRSVGVAEDTLCTLYEKIRQRDEEIARLYPLTSLKLQIKLRLKKWLPSGVYKIVLTGKRLIFGPRNLLFDYNR